MTVLTKLKCDDCECIMNHASQLKTNLKLLGGWAIHYTSQLPDEIDLILSRKPNDIDVIGLRKEKHQIYEVLKSCGYEPDEKFNAFNGDFRLLFHKGDVLLDVFLNEFSMCQDIDMTDRLVNNYPTISVDDLLLTKVQIIEINEKDLKDILRLVGANKINADGSNYNDINLSFIEKMTGENYGFYRSYLQNMRKAMDYLHTLEMDPDVKKEIEDKIKKILDATENSKKSIKWKMRAKIGDSMPWYKLPEEKKR
jgi:hypothetical protein